MSFKRSGGPTGAQPIPGVTAENYLLPLANPWELSKKEGKAMDYARAAGKCFIMTPDMREHCNVWHKYFTIKNDKHQLRSMKFWLKGELGRQHGYQFAVPAEWPWQFDQSVSEEMCRGPLTPRYGAAAGNSHAIAHQPQGEDLV